MMIMAVSCALLEMSVRYLKPAVQCRASNTLIVAGGLSFVFGRRTAAWIGMQASHERVISLNAAREISRNERGV